MNFNETRFSRKKIDYQSPAQILRRMDPYKLIACVAGGLGLVMMAYSLIALLTTN